MNFTAAAMVFGEVDATRAVGFFCPGISCSEFKAKVNLFLKEHSSMGSISTARFFPSTLTAAPSLRPVSLIVRKRLYTL